VLVDCDQPGSTLHSQLPRTWAWTRPNPAVLALEVSLLPLQPPMMMLPLRAAVCWVQVCLTFHPEGAEWAEPEPVLVSEGYLSSTAGGLGGSMVASSST
jgi:hypothetical protein